MASIYFEWTLRIATIGVSAFSFLITRSPKGIYCSEVLGVLSLESEWLTYLVITQLMKVIILAAWQLKLLELAGIEQVGAGGESPGIGHEKGGISYQKLNRFHSEYCDDQERVTQTAKFFRDEESGPELEDIVREMARKEKIRERQPAYLESHW